MPASQTCRWQVSARPFLFFFQAEDGIRDYKVTGVQTCALPIWPRLHLEPGQGVVTQDHRAAQAAGESGRKVARQRFDVGKIGRASCRGKSVDLGGRRIIKKKKKQKRWKL